MVQSLWNTDWQFLKKLHTEFPYDPAIPLLGRCPKQSPVSEGDGFDGLGGIRVAKGLVGWSQWEE